MKIVFDLCGTLFRPNTTIGFIKYLKRQDSFLSRLFFLFVFNFLRVINKVLMKFKFDPLRCYLIFLLSGYDKSDLYCFAESYFDSELKINDIKPVHELLNLYKDHDLYIITATIDPVASIVASRLGVKYWYSTSLSYTPEGICTGRLDIDLLSNKESLFNNEIFDLLITDNISDLEFSTLCESTIYVAHSAKSADIAIATFKNLKQVLYV